MAFCIAHVRRGLISAGTFPWAMLLAAGCDLELATDGMGTHIRGDGSSPVPSDASTTASNDMNSAPDASLTSLPDSGPGGDAGQMAQDAGNQTSMDAGTGPPDVGADAGPSNLVFVTSTFQSAALGGFVGGNKICNDLAQAASLPGTFQVWLSTTTDSAESRFTHSADPYARVDGTRIADNWDDLLDGSLLAPINVDENGVTVGGDVWTGTLSDGSSYSVSDCGHFTSDTTAVRAKCGSSASTGSAWTDNIEPLCSTQLRLYCVEQ